VQDSRRASTHADGAVVNGKVRVGVSGGEFGYSRYVLAYDAMTAEAVAHLHHQFPRPGDPSATPGRLRLEEAASALAWMTGQLRPRSELWLLGIGNAAPWPGVAHPRRQSLHTRSCPRARIRFWARSRPIDPIHPDYAWDWDEVEAPCLSDIEKGGHTIKEPRPSREPRRPIFWFLERIRDIRFVSAGLFSRRMVGKKKFARPATCSSTVDATTSRCSASARLLPVAVGVKDLPSARYRPKTKLFYVPAAGQFCGGFTAKEALRSRPSLARHAARGLSASPSAPARDHHWLISRTWDPSHSHSQNAWQHNFLPRALFSPRSGDRLRISSSSAATNDRISAHFDGQERQRAGGAEDPTSGIMRRAGVL